MNFRFNVSTLESLAIVIALEEYSKNPEHNETDNIQAAETRVKLLKQVKEQYEKSQ